MRALPWVMLGLVACGDGNDGARADASADPDATTSETSETTLEEIAQPSLCDPTSTPVTPVSLDDIDYGARTHEDCFDEACQCDYTIDDRVTKFMACDRVGWGWWEPFGSTYLLVEGIEDGRCVFSVGHEVEGGVSVSRCSRPLPMVPWQGLRGLRDETELSHPMEGIEDDCEQVGSCSVLDGFGTPCDSTVPRCAPGRVDYCSGVNP